MRHGSTSNKGRQGEERAARHLERLGYRIVGRNVKLPGGEVDLVCAESGDLVFVEVKRRDAHGFGTGISAVDRRKRATLRALAADYAQVLAPRAKIRFDIVSIDGNRIAVYRNAF
jgi:putative endonuclease